MKGKISSAILITAAAVLAAVLLPLLAILYFDISGTPRGLLLVLAVALPCLTAYLLAGVYSEKIIKPIKEIDPESLDPQDCYEEVSSIVHRLRRQNSLIDRQMADLRRHQEEFKTIVSNMAEGLVLLDNKLEILSFNPAAARMLGAEKVREGEHFISLNRSRIFVSTVNEATEGRHGEGNITLGSRVYQILANPVSVEGGISGVIVFIIDVTEKQKREEMRKEFTSNVSHELKTPLTSISGISEMLQSGMISEEDIPRFAGTIHDEAGRLLTLINDIIKLSKLDESAITPEKKRVELTALATSVTHRLALVAEERSVDLKVSGDSALVSGNPSVIEEMIYNLTDNAIKYNKEGGSVTITVTSLDHGVQLTVADTGIGIAAEHLDRIFERFYRVDKSHSREIGGTGLGLSIVKHSAEYLGATLSVESRVDSGTAITVVFPPADI